MKLALIDGRAVAVDGRGMVDLAEASGGTFSADLAELYPRWAEFGNWAATHLETAPRKPLPASPVFGAPSPRPRQVFGIGVNYADHAAESGIAAPASPMVFTKFASCIVGASEPLRLTVPTVDWEVELVVVMGLCGTPVSREEAWLQVAGLTIGQDFSDRTLQMAGSHPQFNLAKSKPGYGPIGPWLVTPDALPHRDDLEIRCSVSGDEVQRSRTSKLINDLPRLISYLSENLTLFPGDVIFTGTPSGVGFTRKPPRFLVPGDVVVSTIEGLGELRTVCEGSR